MLKKSNKLKPVPFEAKETEFAKQKSLQAHDKSLIFAWTAPEYVRHDKSNRWYLIAGLIAVTSALVALFFGNWSMALAILVFTTVYWYIDTYHPPKMTSIEISEMGVRIGNLFFPYSQIKAFWIIYDHGIRTLNLRALNHWFGDVVIQLDEIDPVEIRNFLVGQIPEWEGKREPVSETLLRILKF